ncbi:MAG: YrbL family protein [Pseudomonadota bacterium]
MSDPFLQIHSDPIGEGQERICYVHPDDPSKLIKVIKGESDKQTRREMKLYRRLMRRKETDFSQLPRFYGKVQTNLGRGFVTDLVRDYDGSISNSLYWFFERGIPANEFAAYLEELRQYLLRNQIMISADMRRTNVLFQKLSPQQAQLVVIDGLGNHSAINWFDGFRAVSDSKITRRWDRFYRQLFIHSDEMLRDYGGPANRLEKEYQKDDVK